jgi:hypothetical protein
MAKCAVTGDPRGASTRRVDRRSTEPRVGSSNLSGRAGSSHNRRIAGESGWLSQTRRHEQFVGRAVALGLSDVGARRLLSQMRGAARLVAAGRLTAHGAIDAVRSAALTALRRGVST